VRLVPGTPETMPVIFPAQHLALLPIQIRRNTITHWFWKSYDRTKV